MSLRQFLFLTVIAVFLSGCSNGSNRSPDNDVPPVGDDPGGDDGGAGGGGDDGGGETGGSDPIVPPEDVSGAWYSRTEVNAVNCGLGEFIDAQAFDITQDDVNISILSSSGDTFTGTVNGDIVEWTGSFDERGGTTTFTELTLIASGDSASGDASWTWTDGTDSCNGTMVISAARDAAAGEGDKNSRPPVTVDTVTLENSVAFFAGEVVGDDKDYFAITVASDVTLQAQLSHFDTSDDFLDLEVLDMSQNQVAVSENSDVFESINLELTGGATYFIGVLPKVIASEPVGYILSIDVN